MTRAASTDQDWRDRAACLGMTDVFFGPGDETRYQRDKRWSDSKRICRTCPVLASCLRDYGETSEDNISVIAGMTPPERDRYRQRRRRTR